MLYRSNIRSLTRTYFYHNGNFKLKNNYLLFLQNRKKAMIKKKNNDCKSGEYSNAMMDR